ncbi:MAG: hypothetical protein JW741_22255 [Sedimentisphaerales bacterium]|nr:hypothetical protein [Sedimentisphaerales bacterium]
MKPEREIERFVAATQLDTHGEKDRQVLDDVLAAHGEYKERQSQGARKWRIIRGKGMRLPAAAVVILTIGLSVVTLERLTKPAWAIEQTIAAIEGFEALYGSGILSLDGTETEQARSWARPNHEGTGSGDLRMETASGYLVVVNEAQNVTHTYDPVRNVVRIQSGRGLYCDPWIDGDYFRDMKGWCEHWEQEYATDELTDRRCVIVRARNLHDGQSYEYYFDVRTKLPVRGKVWHNNDFAGQPYFDIRKIVYNPVLPEGIFDCPIPPGAVVLDERSN